MNPKRTLMTTFWAMLFVQTIGSIDLPGQGSRKLPAPKNYVAAVVLWGILSMVAESGQAQARVAARLSLLVLLTGAVIGPFGQRAIGFLDSISKRFAVPPPAGASATAPTAPEVQIV